MMNSSSVTVINPRFCVPYYRDLTFTTKPPGEKKSSDLATLDAAGNILFRTERSSFGSYTKLQDAAGRTILSMKSKFRSMHDRWQMFRGESKEEGDLLFSIKRSSVIQFHDEWLVFLAANTDEENCDFRIVGSFSDKNYTIYKGNSSFVVAQLTGKNKLNLPLKTLAFGASVSANCDYAFVTALISFFHVFHSVEASKLKTARLVLNIVGAANDKIGS